MALRGTDLGGLGFQQDDIGRFVGSADPFADDYNPLQGKNLQSMLGTNDLNQMLSKELTRLRGMYTKGLESGGKYKTKSAMETHNQREKRILEMLGTTGTDENLGRTTEEAFDLGYTGSGPFATIQNKGKEYGPFSKTYPEMAKFHEFALQKGNRTDFPKIDQGPIRPILSKNFLQKPIVNERRDTPISVPRNPQKRPSVKPDRDREPSPHSYSHPGSSRSREMSSPFQYGGRAGYSKGGIVTLL